jgi:ABC-2 type transport system ATP-binding protein/lipopolysaccharide transport system ATP-binding protein
MTRIRLSNVSVRLPIYDSHSLRLIRLPSFARAKVGTQTVSHTGNVVVIHALNDLSLDLHDGDRVCVMGHNGAGKTTLLRVIAGIYPPSSGGIDVRGRVFALLGNSMVLNSDATGYENIRLVGNLYHWPKSRMAEYIHDIEEFTELGEYLSLPTRVYSAGMQARLAFAIATTQSPDILLIDEGIGAGDAQFQEKAHQRVQKFVSGARIIVLASHSAELCRAICNKAVLLSKGRQVFFGGIDEAFERYGSAA